MIQLQNTVQLFRIGYMDLGLRTLILAIFVGSMGQAQDTKHGMNTICSQAIPKNITIQKLNYLQEYSLFPRGTDLVSAKRRLCKIKVDQFESHKIDAGQITKVSFHAAALYPLDVAADLIDRIRKKVEPNLAIAEKNLKKIQSCFHNLENKTASSSDCENVVRETKAELNLQLSSVRQALARMKIKTRAAKNDPVLRHPFYVGNAYDKKSQKEFELDPLTKEEVDSLKKALKERNGDLGDPEKEYFELINKNPSLVFFKKSTVTDQELSKALSQPGRFPSELSEKDFVHIDLALNEVLKEVPQEDRGDYCLVARTLRKNKNLQKDAIKLMVNIPLTFAIMVSKFNFVGGTIISYETNAAIEASTAAERLAFNWNLCMRSENYPTTSVGGDTYRSFCDFQSIDRSAKIMRESNLYMEFIKTPAGLREPKSK